ncbi:MAG: nucleoside kinase [Phascolarctobacterium sp.]|uniref:nucleoside kinase n=1 Tax=Phascolarctobacterium sp. TaxID=2049039 RepID=UPI0026DC7F20|nr:nucleoside kinase [Phascolarctobacterium sp.]MDO4921151.1 nucleoside kinase [Phascolarctobacterium sp.]
MLAWKLPDGQLRQVEEGSCLLSLALSMQDKFKSPIVEGVFNGEAVDLQKPLYTDGTVDFIEVNTAEGMRTYTRTLLFMLLAACYKLYPDVDLEVRNTLGSALYCLDKSSIKLTPENIKAIEAYMKQMAAAKEPITLKRFAKSDAIGKTSRLRTPDSDALLEELPDDATLTVYYLQDMPGYFFGAMCPHAGYVPNFELLPYDDGVIINYPDTGDWTHLPPFVDQPRLNAAYQEAEEWSAMLQCNTIGKLNNYIGMGYADRVIQVAEALHEKKLAGIADMIAARKNELKLILIAGPSSSGKTSTAQRLSIQMAVNGLRPMPISMDDYYLNRVDTPRKADGSYDFECLEAIDLELFNEHLQKLLAGEKIKLPKYNFRTGCREYRGSELQMTDNSVLVVEGIHGLNEKLTASIPAANKMKLYVSALTPMSFDAYNRIHTTDVRLLRRIVRDSQFRSHDAEATLALWKDVREGEEKYIFPFQCSADVIFNTTLIYELAVLKKYAVPLLEAVQPQAGRAYLTARRLLNMLYYVKQIDDTAIPNNSILREFVGGSIFKDAL